MFERLPALARIKPSDGVVRKAAEHGLLHAANVTAFNGQPDDGGRDALGDRGHVVPRPPIVGITVGIEPEASAANELDAVDGNLPFAYEVEHLDKRHGVDADFFGRSSLPCLG